MNNKTINLVKLNNKAKKLVKKVPNAWTSGQSWSQVPGRIHGYRPEGHPGGEASVSLYYFTLLRQIKLF